MTAYDIVIRPIITERAMAGAADKKYVFEVAKDAGKIEIKKAVEEIFGVKVASVNTLTVSGKEKRMGAGRPGMTKTWKKAYVQLTDPGFQDHRVLRRHGLINGRSVTRNVYQNF